MPCAQSFCLLLHLALAGALSGAAVARRTQEYAHRHRGAGLEGCILMLDDRYTPELTARNISSAAEAEGLPYYEAAFHINRLYARRHGYAFRYQGAGSYTAPDDRSVAWRKVQLLRDQLECCCQWALWMDSDSYFVMRQHALSVEGWLSLISDSSPRFTTLLGNMYPYVGLREGGEPVAAVSTNEPHELGSQFFCTSNMLFTRSRRSTELLNYWYNETSLVPDLVEFLKEFPWEQAPFNYAVTRRFQEAVEPFPIGQVQGFSSEFIHNVNHYYWQERIHMPAQHLKDVLVRG